MADEAGLDFYAILGVTRKASADEIKAAWRKKAMEHHPDRTPGPDSEEAFKSAEEAYRCLGDPARRRVYDQTGIDSGSATILSDALDAVTSIAAAAIEKNYTDLLGYMSGSIEGTLLSAESHIVEANIKIRALARRRGLVKKHKAGENLIDRLLDKKIAELKAEIAVENRTILVQRAAAEIVADYYMDGGTLMVDKPRPPVMLGS